VSELERRKKGEEKKMENDQPKDVRKRKRLPEKRTQQGTGRFRRGKEGQNKKVKVVEKVDGKSHVLRRIGASVPRCSRTSYWQVDARDYTRGTEVDPATLSRSYTPTGGERGVKNYGSKITRHVGRSAQRGSPSK